ncbi:LysR family transcriptional regulator [Futiania mangrovi]|uniref:LysR substrate-binding domain-containing protein n=1 Tax=Futiania mangrovi TaxID=2959716 RepID=A0A9J6PCB1_9PROT|nr:LysR family transcriptional regulator [Futiania mangrovii]MCP1337852.1 LysR substrate-binding domain-containing protein [Futiania mangrovii]
MAVTIAYLRAFVEVARCGNFTRAAEKLSVTQPSLSVAIRQLEEALNLKLFDRTTRRLSLTEEGAKFLPTVARLLEDFDTAVTNARAIAERKSGRVSLAVLPSIATMLIPRVVASFSEAFPGIKVHLRDDNTSGVWRRVGSGEVDFGIAGAFAGDPDLAFTPLFSDRFGAVFRKDHVLARRSGPLSWAEIADMRIIGLAADTGIQPLIGRLTRIPERVRAPGHEVSNIVTVLSLVEAGLGITAIPAFAAMLDRHPALMYRELTRPAVTRQIGLVTRRGRSLSPAAESFRTELARAVPSVLTRPEIFIDPTNE